MTTTPSDFLSVRREFDLRHLTVPWQYGTDCVQALPVGIFCGPADASHDMVVHLNFGRKAPDGAMRLGGRAGTCQRPQVTMRQHDMMSDP